MRPFTISVKIYYKDTDCGSVVYYANYLKYFEIARTEFIESKGLSMKQLMKEGIYFVVKEAHIEYKKPGRYGDILLIDTIIKETGHTFITFEHRVRREYTNELLVTAHVKIVAVNQQLRPVKISDNIVKKLL